MTDSQNPLLAKLRVIDGLTVRLPSRGLLYTKGVELHEDVVDGEIRVFPMTTRDELLLRSPDGLYGGTTMKTVFARCVPQVLDPSQLFFTDIDFIMVALRRISYGDEMTIEYKHDCENAKEHTYNIRVDKLMSESREIDPMLVDEQFTILLPSSQEVKLQPIRLQDFLRILQPPSQEEITEEQAEEEMVRLYMAQIASVDGITDRNLIYEWMRELPTMYVKLIREKIASAGDWGVSYSQDIKCRDCGTVTTISTPINPVTFFS